MELERFGYAGRRRRRLLSAVAGLALVGTLLVAITNLAAASAPGRKYVTLEKLCKTNPKQKYGPVFVIHNLTGTTLTNVVIADRYFIPKNGLVSAPMTLQAGDTTWTAPSAWPWKSKIGSDHKYYVFYTVDVNGVPTAMKTAEYCNCSPNGTPPTTKPPRTTTTKVPKPTTTTAPLGTTTTTTTQPTTTTAPVGTTTTTNETTFTF